jgi:hypothetical protein
MLMQYKFINNSRNIGAVFAVVATAIAALISGGCDSNRPVVIPCPACVDPAATPRADCMVVRQKIYYYCDEPVVELITTGPNAGRYQVRDPICRGEDGSPNPGLRPIRINSLVYARGPEVCEPGGAPAARQAYRQLKADYDYNLALRGDALRQACSDAEGSCENLSTLISAHSQLAAMSQQQLFKAGVMPLQGDSSISNVILVGDLGILKKRYQNARDLYKLLAPRHFYCSPGPILACAGAAGACEGSEYVDSSFTNNNNYGCQPGVTAMYGALEDSGGASNYAGGPAGLAGMIRGIVDSDVRRDVQKRTANNAKSFDSAAKASGGLIDPGAVKGGGGASGVSMSGAGGGLGSGLGSAGGGTAGSSGPGLSKSSGSGTGGLANMEDKEDTESDGALGEGEKVAFETVSGSGGGGGKPASNPLAGLLGGFGANTGAGGAGSAAAKSVQFGGAGAAGAGAYGALTDAELEALLNHNSGSSLFEIASRRYFKWGATVMGSSSPGNSSLR